MTGAVRAVSAAAEKSAIAREVLLDLPEWFGVPEYTQEYITACAALPFWTYEIDGEAVGFIARKETGSVAAELFVMGVKKAHHRNGIGRTLFGAMREDAKARGYQFLQVKTVDEGHYKEYDDTRLFYESLGFQKLEVLPDLWDAHNPCLIMVMYIQ
ncbi:MAG: GNAT family N-acetyltransferase [Clostridiales bacterium]|nr:GNAT family N-acetyltransferase [Clostridiales bacterium]